MVEDMPVTLEQTKERFKKWLENDDFILCLNSVENHLLSLSDPNSSCYYTPHAHEHCFSVEKIVKALVNNSLIKLNELEIFFYFWLYGPMTWECLMIYPQNI